MLDTEKHAGDVDVHGAVEVVQGTVGKKGCGLDAGVVHHHVEPAEAIDASLHRSFPVGLGGDVQAHEVGLVGAKLRRQGLARSVKDVGNDDTGAAGDQGGRHGRGEAAGTAGDENDFSVNLKGIHRIGHPKLV